MADSQRKTANLFDYQTMGGTIKGYYLDSEGELQPSSTAAVTDYIPCSGGSFTLDKVGGISPSICLYDENKQFLYGKAYNTSGGSDKQTIIVDTSFNASFIRFTYFYTGAPRDDLSTIMLNTGSQPLPYEPYGWQHSLRKLGTSTDTITTLPADVYADGNNATVGLVGNMQQSGTPSPTTPIQPSECGERTGNLFDKSTWDNVTATRGTVDVVANGIRLTATANDAYTQTYGNAEYSYPVTAGETYTLSWDIDNPNVYGIVYLFSGSTTGDTVLSNVVASAKKATFTIPNGHQYLSFRLGVSSSGDTLTYTNLMLNTGETALSFEPFGVKIPILSADTTTPVYLGEVESTRRIRKYEFTGQESGWGKISTGRMRCALPNSPLKGEVCFCSHYVGTNASQISSINDGECTISASAYDFVVYDADYTTYEDYATWVAQQYANGTPVTVWYVLPTEETGIVNEPLRKIGDYADTVSDITIPTITGKDSFDVLTTLKPSEVELTYTGWHDASVKEWDGSEWQ